MLIMEIAGSRYNRAARAAVEGQAAARCRGEGGMTGRRKRKIETRNDEFRR